jgi:hypothetical protein
VEDGVGALDDVVPVGFVRRIASVGRLVVSHSGPAGMLEETTGALMVPPPQRLLLSPMELTERRRPL